MSTPAVPPSPPRRRWLRRALLYAPLLAIVLAVLLHPYPRQTLFGPTVDGVPVAYWQDVYRAQCDRRGSGESLVARALHQLGFEPAAVATADFNRDDMLPVVLGLVGDPSAGVRAEVAHNLTRRPLSDESSTGLLRLLNDPEPWVRSQTAWALSFRAVNLDAALARLIELADDPDALCRVNAAAAAHFISDKSFKRATRILTAALKDSDPEVRRQAASHLLWAGEDNPAIALPALATCVEGDPDPTVRRYSAVALLPFGRAAVPTLAVALRDQDSLVRGAAAGILGRIGPEARDAVPALDRLRNDPDADVRQRALGSLAYIDPKRYPPTKDEPRDPGRDR
jgi:HEAT repeat protein